MNEVFAVIMAAGEGKRMKSALPKVLHRICGEPMIGHVLRAAADVACGAVVIVGVGADAVRAGLPEGTETALQAEQLGTGHAVMCARESIARHGGRVLVLAGDMPLIKGETLKKLAEEVQPGVCDAAVLTAVVDDAAGYGRILRDENGNVCGIVEHREATEEQRSIREINYSV